MVRGRAVSWAIALVVVNGSGGRVSSRRRPWMKLEGNEMDGSGCGILEGIEDCRLGLDRLGLEYKWGGARM